MTTPTMSSTGFSDEDTVVDDLDGSWYGLEDMWDAPVPFEENGSSIDSDVPMVLANLSPEAVRDLTEAGLPRAEILVRAHEQAQVQTATIISLEHQLSKARKALREIRWASNALHRLNLLPVELLGHIFFLAYDYDYREDNCDVYYWRPIQLSHVCQHWRNVALATPDLWAQIPLYKLDVAGVFLTRARSAPLDMKVCQEGLITEARSRTQIKFIIKHAQQLRSLRLILDHQWLIIATLVLKFTSAPRLQYLSIHHRHMNQHEIAMLGMDQFFGGSAPSLRRARFGFVPVPWTGSFLLGGELRTLEVTGQKWAGVEELLPILRANPRLEKLRLDTWLRRPESSSSNLHQTYRISLPLLRTISLTDVDIDLEHLFCSIDTQANVRIAFASMRNEDTSYVETLVSHPHERLGHLTAFQGHHVTTVDFDVRNYSTRLTTSRRRPTVETLEMDLEDSDDCYIYQIKVASRAHSWIVRMFASIGTSIPLSNLLALNLHGLVMPVPPSNQGLIEPEKWRVLFSSLPSLEVLTFNDTEFTDAVSVLAELQDGTAVCPNLKYINIQMNPFWSFWSKTTLQNSLQVLLDCVKKRRVPYGGAVALRMLLICLKPQESFRPNTIEEYATQLDTLGMRASDLPTPEHPAVYSWKWVFGGGPVAL